MVRRRLSTAEISRREDGRGEFRSGPSFAEDGRLRLIDLPAEEVVIAGPFVDLGPANFAREAAGMLG